MSWTRLCGDCARVRLLGNLDELHGHTGPAFKRWRRAIAASVGAVLIDDIDIPD